MKFSLLNVYFSTLIIGIASAQLMVNTPVAAVICQPLLLDWSGGIPPYFPSIVPGSETGAAPLRSFSQQTTTSLVWIPDFPPGSVLAFAVRDATGEYAQSAAFTIQDSPNKSCVNK